MLTLLSVADRFAFSGSAGTLRIRSLSGCVLGARRAPARRTTRTLARCREKSADAKTAVIEAARLACKARYWGSRKPVTPSCLMRREQAARSARILAVRRLSAVLILLFALIVEPSGDVARGNRPSWFMRINCAGVDDQSLVEFRPGEVLGFRFSLKCLGRSRASPLQQCAAFVDLKSNVPSIRHLS
jgi:hypothetical protein